MPNANHLSRDRSQQIHRNRGIIFVSVEAEHSQFPSITVFYGKVADTNRPGRGWIFSESVFGRWFYPWDRGSLARRRGTFAASFLAKIEGLRAEHDRLKAEQGGSDERARAWRPELVMGEQLKW
jgi:hypothetical protein